MRPPNTREDNARSPGRLAADLDVANAVGVSPVDWDTRLLASKAVELGGRSVLDMGTGTGFVAI